MGMIVCGWCGRPTRDEPRCDRCGHVDPRIPYIQRGLPVPTETEVRKRRLHEAEASLRAQGEEPTAERIAERLDVSPRTVRRWQQMSTPRPSVPPAQTGE